MSQAEWLAHLQRLSPDLARAICRVGLTVDGVRRFPTSRFALVPTNDSAPAKPEKDSETP